jgi:hypothetical protein
MLTIGQGLRLGDSEMMIDANKESFIQADKDYVENQNIFENKFIEFIKLVKPLEDSLKSLVFVKPSKTQIEFIFLGRPCCIRLEYTGHSDKGKLIGTSIISGDKIPISMDKSGRVYLTEVGRGDDVVIGVKQLGTESDFSETVFFALLGGTFNSQS